MLWQYYPELSMQTELRIIGTLYLPAVRISSAAQFLHFHPDHRGAHEDSWVIRSCVGTRVILWLHFSTTSSNRHQRQSTHPQPTPSLPMSCHCGKHILLLLQGLTRVLLGEYFCQIMCEVRPPHRQLEVDLSPSMESVCCITKHLHCR